MNSRMMLSKFSYKVTKITKLKKTTKPGNKLDIFLRTKFIEGIWTDSSKFSDGSKHNLCLESTTVQIYLGNDRKMIENKKQTTALLQMSSLFSKEAHFVPNSDISVIWSTEISCNFNSCLLSLCCHWSLCWHLSNCFRNYWRNNC